MSTYYIKSVAASKNKTKSAYMIPYFSDHCTSMPNPNSNPNPNPDNSPDYDCSHLLVRDVVVRNAEGRKGGHLLTRVVKVFLVVKRKTSFGAHFVKLC